MILEFGREDLNPEHKDLPTSAVKYDHLTKAAQLAVSVVGKATFWEDDRRNYNAVYPPPDQDWELEKFACDCPEHGGAAL